MKQLLFVFIYTSLLFLPIAHSKESSGSSENIDGIRLADIAASATWKRLIHAKDDGFSGAVLDVTSDGFYLSPRADFTALAELEATLDAFANGTVDTAPSAACRFPARFLWLSEQLPQFRSRWIQPECTELEQWADFQNMQGLSLVQVSGYFGNPASAFGHLLLQVNKTDSKGLRGLQDTGINFGAKIPDNENTIAYIFKGLFGAYNASFSDKSFYAQDHVYSATEFRDMWSYELNLSAFQQKMLIYHLWELKDALFTYYFLKINCAYHLAQLMELVLEIDFNLSYQPWYLPVSLFHKISDIDSNSPGSLIKNVRFIPSVQREAYVAFDALSISDQLAANDYISADMRISPPDNASPQLLDFLLIFQDYKTKGNTSNSPETIKQRKQALLLARLNLPVQSSSTRNDSFSLDNYPPPATGPRSRKVGLGVHLDSEENITQKLVIAPFAVDILQQNQGSLIDSNFKLGETTFRIDNGDVYLSQFDILRVEKLLPPLVHIPGEQRWAWRLAFGAQQLEQYCRRCLTPFFNTGLGISRRMAQGILGFAFTTVDINRRGLNVGLSGGLLLDLTPEFRMRWDLELDVFNEQKYSSEPDAFTQKLSALYALNKQWDLKITGRRLNNDNTYSLLSHYRW